MVKKIMYGILKCTLNIDTVNKCADFELFDRQSGASLLVNVDNVGVVRFKETPNLAPIKKKHDVKKALHKCFIEYDKAVA